MPDPFRLRVQKALTTELETISVAGGSKWDMAGKVFRGRVYYGEETPVPFISILEEPIAPETDLEPSNGVGGTSPYDLMVQGYVQDDPDHPTDEAHFLLADTKKVLARIREEGRRTDRLLAFGNDAPTVVGISFGGGVVRPADEVSAVAYFWLRVTLELVEDHNDPYA